MDEAAKRLDQNGLQEYIAFLEKKESDNVTIAY